MAKVTLVWSHAAETDHPDVYYRVYENGKQIVDKIGELTLSILMDGKPTGQYTFDATTVDSRTLLESPHSNSVIVNFTLPAAPTGLKASLTA